MSETTKNPVGKPLKFKSPEELQIKIDKYFKDCDKNKIPYTITGLALALDTTRQGLINYEKREKYYDTIKKGKLRVENSYELSLRTNGRAGDIFGLKNFGWKDRQEIEHTGEVTGKIIIERPIRKTDADKT